MNYKAEDEEDKKYKKGYGRTEFKKDVADAVEPVLKKGKKVRKKKKGKMPPQFANPEAAPVKKKKVSKSAYAKMSTKELRKILTDKKKALLKKSGFPESGLPRSKEEMINLCVKLKRKRW